VSLSNASWPIRITRVHQADFKDEESCPGIKHRCIGGGCRWACAAATTRGGRQQHADENVENADAEQQSARGVAAEEAGDGHHVEPPAITIPGQQSGARRSHAGQNPRSTASLRSTSSPPTSRFPAALPAPAAPKRDRAATDWHSGCAGGRCWRRLWEKESPAPAETAGGG